MSARGILIQKYGTGRRHRPIDGRRCIECGCLLSRYNNRRRCAIHQRAWVLRQRARLF